MRHARKRSSPTSGECAGQQQIYSKTRAGTMLECVRDLPVKDAVLSVAYGAGVRPAKGCIASWVNLHHMGHLPT